jgi:hypothetical protein
MGIGGFLGKALGGMISPVVSTLGGPERSGGAFTDVNSQLGLDPRLMQQGQMQLSRLQNTAQGRGPSMAMMAANAANQQGRASLESQAASDRRNPALARRNAMLQGGQLSARIGQQAMMGRLAEQQQAEQALAQAVHNARLEDLQRAKIVEDQRGLRYQTLMGTPSSFERGANVIASVLPFASKSGGGGKP